MENIKQNRTELIKTAREALGKKEGDKFVHEKYIAVSLLFMLPGIPLVFLVGLDFLVPLFFTLSGLFGMYGAYLIIKNKIMRIGWVGVVCWG